MKKRIRRKLSPFLREKIKKDYRRLKQSDFSGEALTYLKKVRALARARNVKKNSRAQIGGVTIAKNTELYNIIEKAAKAKKMTVAEFIRKNKKAIQGLLQEGDIVVQRETEYLIRDIDAIGKGRKVFVNSNNGFVKTSKHQAVFLLQNLMMHCAALTDIFMLIYRVHYKLNGDLYFYCPEPGEYEDLTDQEEITAMLDEYSPEIIYIISARKEAE